MHLRLSALKFILLVLLSLLFVAQPSWAGRVFKVKGKKIFIILSSSEAEQTKKKDALYLTTKSGKKKGIVTVVKMRGNKVIAKLRKGKAKKGMRTLPRRGKKQRMARDDDGDSDEQRDREEEDDDDDERAEEIAEDEGSDSNDDVEDLRFGLLGSFGTATQNVNNVADMSGSTTGFKGLIDYALFDELGVRARIGMDILSVAGTGSGIDFETSITYLTLDFLLRYYFYNGESFGFFANAGMGIYSPMSTDLTPPSPSSAIQEDSISTTSLLIFGVGGSFPLGGSMELFIGVDALFFPPSDDVSTSAFQGKAGLLFAL